MELKANEQILLSIPTCSGCTDTLESLGNGQWKWIRTCENPVSQMKMVVEQVRPVTYWQVPAVNYNGNGWGSGAQYSGFGCDGEPWTYAWHRVAVPACTIAEQDGYVVGLFGDQKGGMSCSIWEKNGCACQALLWPEVEGPKVLSKRYWMERYEGTMEPCDTFTALLCVKPVVHPGRGYQQVLDFAWHYFDRTIEMEWQPEQLMKLDNSFFRILWHKRSNGLVGFSKALHWNEERCQFVRLETFESGWVGQNISVSCAMLREYLRTGQQDLRDKAIAVLDSWVKYARLPNGLFFVKLIAPPDHLDSVDNGTIPLELEATGLGAGAQYMMQASKLAEKAGFSRPEYAKMGLDLCDFLLKAQSPDGEFAKSYFLDGSVDKAHGTVGACLILPLFEAWKLTGKQAYLNCALRGFQFYNDAFQQNGFTTAGALDSNCIDKESAAPLLRAAIMAYDVTGDKQYVAWAEDIAYYLNTWQWHYSTDFPEGSILKEIRYDTYGGTSVSTAHNAQDNYGLYYVPEFLRLAELTGKDIWRKRARALWYNGIQRISDGTLVIEGRVRPAGSQDESCRHTRWGRTDLRFFVTSGNLNPWPAAFREVTMDLVEDWNLLR